MNAYHCECLSATTTEELSLKSGLKPKNRKGKKIKFNFDFDCLPYVLRGLSGIWQDERKSRLDTIESINRRLPDCQ